MNQKQSMRTREQLHTLNTDGSLNANAISMGLYKPKTDPATLQSFLHVLHSANYFLEFPHFCFGEIGFIASGEHSHLKVVAMMSQLHFKDNREVVVIQITLGLLLTILHFAQFGCKRTLKFSCGGLVGGSKQEANVSDTRKIETEKVCSSYRN